MTTESKPPFPPFTIETATQKVKAAQDAWNTKSPEVVQFAYTPDSIWRNRDTFLQGRAEIVDFLKNKWTTENGYRLRKELFAFTDNKVYYPRRVCRCTALMADRSPFSFGMNGTMRAGSGGGHMGKYCTRS